MNAALKSVTALPGGFCSLEDERMKHIAQLTAENRSDTAAGPGQEFLRVISGCGKPLRKREGDLHVSSRSGIAAGGSSKPSRLTGHGPLSWRVSRTGSGSRSGLQLSMPPGRWPSVFFPGTGGWAFPRQRSVPSLQYLREYTLTVLTARIGDAEPSAAKGLRAGRLCFLGTIRLSGPNRTPV